MKKIVFAVSIICALALPGFAQFGFEGGYNSVNAKGWNDLVAEEDFLDQGYSAGIYYWFRLKDRRIEFTPRLSFQQFETTLPSVNEQSDPVFSSQWIDFNFDTNIYLLDLEGDCDCPTWGKDGTFLDKGFFLQVSPGIGFFSHEMNGDQTVSENAVAPSLGIGLGLDIGVAPILTLTPLVRFRQHFGVNWNELAMHTDNRPSGPDADERSGISQWFVGLRLGIRLDEIGKW